MSTVSLFGIFDVSMCTLDVNGKGDDDSTMKVSLISALKSILIDAG